MQFLSLVALEFVRTNSYVDNLPWGGGHFDGHSRKVPINLSDPAVPLRFLFKYFFSGFGKAF